MAEPTMIGEFMAEKNIKRLVRSGLHAAAAAHPGCIDLTLTKSIVNTISEIIIERYKLNPTPEFMEHNRLEHVLVGALRKSEGINVPLLDGSIAKRIRMAIVQSYDSRVRGLDTSGQTVYNSSSAANLIDAVAD